MLQLEGIVLNVVGVILHQNLIGLYFNKTCSALMLKLLLLFECYVCAVKFEKKNTAYMWISNIVFVNN